MAHRTQHIVAVYPGSFDPVTYGHLDVIRRASALFNELVIGVGMNPDKQPMFTPAERIELIEPHLRSYPNVRVEAYDGLTIDFVRRVGGRVMVRGIRDIADFSGELQQASLNMAIGEIDTVFLLTSDQYVLTSSTYIKQIYELGGMDTRRIKRLVPPNVAQRLEAQVAAQRSAGSARKTSRRAPRTPAASRRPRRKG